MGVYGLYSSGSGWEAVVGGLDLVMNVLVP
jgi:hypothetical protein